MMKNQFILKEQRDRNEIVTKSLIVIIKKDFHHDDLKCLFKEFIKYKSIEDIKVKRYINK